MASKLHSGTAAYSSYIELISTGIVYPQQEDPNIQINQYNYFNIIGSIPPIANHGIWGCLHFLPLVSNIFLACYDSGTFLSHLTDGGYGFNALGSPGIDMYQIYNSTNLMAGLLETLKYAPHFSGLSSIDVKLRLMWLLVRRTSFERGGVWVLSVTPCQLGFVSTSSFLAQV